MTLEELKKLCDKASPGPWRYRDMDESIVSKEDWKLEDGNKIVGSEVLITRPFAFAGDMQWENGLFIAAARTYMPLLIRVAQLVEAQPLYFRDARDRALLKEALAAIKEAK